MQFDQLKRREFITLFGGAAVAWPLAARAQQQAMPTVGFVRITTPEDSAHLVAAFRNGLAEIGYVEGQNVTIEYRYALNQVERLPAIMAELVGQRVAVLAATGGTISARAAKATTATIPFVFTTGDDPVDPYRGRGRRIDVLGQHSRCLSSGRRLCRTDSQEC
jgi:putative ABC transport system substrate-binding protein